MGMGGRTAMSTERARMHREADILTLAQWLSPSFPIGAFAYSHGVEAAVASGWVQDRDGLQGWLLDALRYGTGRSDAIWLRLGAAADDADLLRLDAEARAFAPAVSRRVEAERQGAAFVKTVGAVWSLPLPDVVLPLAVGAAMGRHGIETELGVMLYLQAFVSNIASAAQRLMPLGQTQAQGVIAALQPACREVAQETQGARLADIESHCFLSDIAAMRHDTLEPRMFQS